MRTIGLIGCLTFAAACGGRGSDGGSGSAGSTGGGAAGSAGQVDAGGDGGGGTGGGGHIDAGVAGGAGQSSAGVGGSSSGGGAGGVSSGSAGQAGNRTNPLSQVLINAFVAAHNQARSGSLTPMPSPALAPVSWDPVLADTTYNYTTKCQGQNGLLSHNPNRTTDYRALGGTESYVGENIYATTGNTVQPAEAVQAWMDEAPGYNYATNTSSGVTGHYTQVVWRASIHIGCAIFDCPTLQFHNTVLCDYAPGGNIVGDRPY